VNNPQYEIKQAEATTEVVQEDGTLGKSIEKVGDPKLFEQPSCNVGYGLGFTEPMGNYRSVRAYVSLNVPCVHSEIDEVYDFAKEWVDARIQVLFNEIAAQKSGV